MIKVSITANNGRISTVVPETDSLRKVLDDNEINYGPCVVYVNGDVAKNHLDDAIGDLSSGDVCYISCAVKADNAAEVKVVGNACVLTSDVDFADYEKIAKYDPESLYLTKTVDGKTSKYFGVAIGKNPTGNYNEFGVTFDSTPDSNGKAIVTLLYDSCGEAGHIVEAIEEDLGSTLYKLLELEPKLADVVTRIDERRAQIMDHITVI